MNPPENVSRILLLALISGMLLLFIAGCPGPQNEKPTGSPGKDSDGSTNSDTKLPDANASVDTGVEGHIFTFPKETDPAGPDIQEEPDILPEAEEELNTMSKDQAPESK